MFNNWTFFQVFPSIRCPKFFFKLFYSFLRNRLVHTICCFVLYVCIVMSCHTMFVCFIHILLFLSFNTRWVRWVWLPTSPTTILIDGSLDDLVPTPVPAFTYPTAMSHLPSSSVRDHMKWVCFDNTKVITNDFTCSLVSLRMMSLMTTFVIVVPLILMS